MKKSIITFEEIYKKIIAEEKTERTPSCFLKRGLRKSSKTSDKVVNESHYYEEDEDEDEEDDGVDLLPAIEKALTDFGFTLVDPDENTYLWKFGPETNSGSVLQLSVSLYGSSATFGDGTIESQAWIDVVIVNNDDECTPVEQFTWINEEFEYEDCDELGEPSGDDIESVTVLQMIWNLFQRANPLDDLIAFLKNPEKDKGFKDPLWLNTAKIVAAAKREFKKNPLGRRKFVRAYLMPKR